MNKLFCVPLGQNAREVFYDKLQNVGYNKGVLVLPSKVLMKQAERSANIRTIDIDFLANTILNDNGYLALRQINRHSQELVLQILVKYLEQKNKLQYFKKLTEKKGFVKALTSLMGQLSRSGAHETQIAEALAIWEKRTENQRQKDLEIAQIYAMYRTYLKNENWFDLEGKYRLAIKVLQEENVKIRWQEICLSDFYTFDALQLEFLRALGKHCQISLGLMYEENRENVFVALKNTYGTLAGFCELEKNFPVQKKSFALEHITKNFRRKAEKIAAEGCVRTCQFTDRESEMRWVLTEVKQLLRSGAKAEDILVTMRSLDDYAGLRNIADEYGIPISLPQSSALNVQPLTEFLLLLLDAQADNRQGAEAYFKILTSEFGKQLFQVDVEMADSLREERYFTSRRKVQEKVRELFQEDALQVVDACLEKLPARATITEFAEVLNAWLESLALERTLGELYKQGEIVYDALKFLLQSKQAIVKCLQNLVDDYQNCKLEQEKFALADFKDIFVETMQDYQLTLAPGRNDGVLITDVLQAQGLQYKYIYLMGLREGEFPSGRSENWIYNDAERGELSALGIDMPNTALAYAEEAYFFAAVIAQAQERLVLTWHKDDEAGVSAYVEEVQKLFTDVVTEDIYTKADASKYEACKEATEISAFWLMGTFGAAQTEAVLIDRHRAMVKSNNLQDADVCRAVRKKVGNIFSATMLESYAQCPFRFLGERVWKQRGFMEKEELAAPADTGSILHDTLAEFIGKHLQEKITKYDFAELWEELLGVYTQVCEKYHADGRLEFNPLWQAEQKRLHNILRQWLHLEYAQQSKWENFVPCAVEWDFSSKNGKPLRLSLPDGSKFSVIGRIDRIDSNGNKVFITDYKFSGAPSGADLTDGLDLQLPVYLLAADALYGKLVAGGGYLVLKEAERKSSIGFEDLEGTPFKVNASEWADFKTASVNTLKNYVQNIYAGNFDVQPTKACSPYCPLKDICRYRLLGGAADE